MAQLLRSEELPDGEHLADTFLRLTRRTALARRPPVAVGESDQGSGARARLSAMLARLPPSQAVAVSLAYGEGLSEAEVALATSSDEDLTRASIREGLAVLVDAPRSTRESG
jgi:DNA-directed RNA polymerase specialized sigma24 family protein